MSIKSLVYRVGGRVLRIVPPSKVVRVMSGVNKGMRWVRGAANCPEWLGSYEKEHQTLIRSLVHPGMVVFDVGANVGFFTLAFARLVEPTGRVYAFEPLAANVAKLLRHVRLNDITNTFIVQSAVGEKTVPFMAFDVGCDDFQGKVSQTGASPYLVSVVGLDDLYAREMVPLPDVVKMDIEGGEFRALQGALGILRRKKPQIILSVHGKAQEDQCSALLQDLGYSRRLLHDDSGPNKDYHFVAVDAAAK